MSLFLGNGVLGRPTAARRVHARDLILAIRLAVPVGLVDRVVVDPLGLSVLVVDDVERVDPTDVLSALRTVGAMGVVAVGPARPVLEVGGSGPGREDGHRQTEDEDETGHAPAARSTSTSTGRSHSGAALCRHGTLSTTGSLVPNGTDVNRRGVKKDPQMQVFHHSPGWTRTSNPPVNSRMVAGSSPAQ